VVLLNATHAQERDAGHLVAVHGRDQSVEGGEIGQVGVGVDQRSGVRLGPRSPARPHREREGGQCHEQPVTHEAEPIGGVGGCQRGGFWLSGAGLYTAFRAMDLALSESQELIRKEVSALARGFGWEYWREKDRKGEYPTEFVEAFARAGWLGIVVPEAYGGSGLGVVEAALMLEAI